MTTTIKHAFDFDAEAFSAVNAERCALWHPGFPDDDDWKVDDWLNAMQGEVGEAQNIIKKIRRWDTGAANATRDPSRSELQMMLGYELADVYCYLDLLCAKVNQPLAGFEAREPEPNESEPNLARRGVMLNVSAAMVSVYIDFDQSLDEPVGSLLANLAGIAEVQKIDLPAAITEKFNVVSIRQDFPQRFGG